MKNLDAGNYVNTQEICDLKPRPHVVRNPATKSRAPSVSKNPRAIRTGKILGARTIFGAADEEEDFPFAWGTEMVVAGSTA